MSCGKMRLATSDSRIVTTDVGLLSDLVDEGYDFFSVSSISLKSNLMRDESRTSA